MALERYVISGAKKLRCGFTTGVCAAAAAKAATVMLISGKAVEQGGGHDAKRYPLGAGG